MRHTLNGLFARLFERKFDITRMTLPQAILYFESRGVGTVGVRTQAQLNEALNGHLSMVYTHTRAGKRLANDIETYLRSQGLGRGDIKQTRTQQDWSHKMMQGRPTVGWWLRTKLKVEEWWLKKRHKRK
jgi:hypothetical protein